MGKIRKERKYVGLKIKLKESTLCLFFFHPHMYKIMYGTKMGAAQTKSKKKKKKKKGGAI